MINWVGLSRHHVLVSELNHCVPLLSLWLILPTPNQIGPAPNCICESTELPLMKMKMKLGFSDFCTQSHTQVRFCHSRTQHHLGWHFSGSVVLSRRTPWTKIKPRARRSSIVARRYEGISAPYKLFQNKHDKGTIEF